MYVLPPYKGLAGVLIYAEILPRYVREHFAEKAGPYNVRELESGYLSLEKLEETLSMQLELGDFPVVRRNNGNSVEMTMQEVVEFLEYIKEIKLEFISGVANESIRYLQKPGRSHKLAELYDDVVQGMEIYDVLMQFYIENGFAAYGNSSMETIFKGITDKVHDDISMMVSVGNVIMREARLAEKSLPKYIFLDGSLRDAEGKWNACIRLQEESACAETLIEIAYRKFFSTVDGLQEIAERKCNGNAHKLIDKNREHFKGNLKAMQIEVSDSMTYLN